MAPGLFSTTTTRRNLVAKAKGKEDRNTLKLGETEFTIKPQTLGLLKSLQGVTSDIQQLIAEQSGIQAQLIQLGTKRAGVADEGELTDDLAQEMADEEARLLKKHEELDLSIAEKRAERIVARIDPPEGFEGDIVETIDVRDLDAADAKLAGFDQERPTQA
jgi:hypothetical protein